MPKTKISEFSATANSNTDINSINIAEGCAPSNINDAIRELMAELKDFQAGTKGDSFNGPVGATTPASGAFTTLSSTGNTTLGDASGDTVTINGTTTFVNVNPTLSAGTANGVLYLNGSKVATSGSALTFNGTVLYTNGKIGVGETNPGALFEGRNTSIVRMDADSTAVYFGSGNNYPVSFKVNDSEQMRLTSTGLGIGTSSPLTKLDIKFATDKHALFLASASYSNGADLVATNDSGTEIALGLGGSNVRFYTGATERMRLDSSGNLGLGVTPSAWQSGRKALQVGNASINSFSNSQNQLGANFYYDGTNNKYISSDFSTVYQQLSGQHQWYTAASGTAGNTITFTQAATLTAGGNYLLGETSDYLASRLLVKTTTTDNSTNALTLRNSASTELLRVRSDGYTYAGFYPQTTGSSANVFIGSGGDLLRSTSSLKYKKNVQNAVHGLADVLKLRPVTYEGKSETDAGKTFGGLIAEEVHDAGLTEFVQYAEDGTPDALAYGNMVSLCIKAIQELKAEFDAYKATHP